MNLQIFIFQSQILHRDVQDFDLKENIWAKMEIWERNGTEQNTNQPTFLHQVLKIHQSKNDKSHFQTNH
jgi:hypothetical protein